MQPTPTPIQLAVDEYVAAQMLSKSVDWLRKDRIGKRLIPFYRIGRSVRYDPGRMREALQALEEGGTDRKRRP